MAVPVSGNNTEYTQNGVFYDVPTNDWFESVKDSAIPPGSGFTITYVSYHVFR